MKETDKSPARARTPRWVSVLLALSLTGNLIVVGIFAGAALRSDGSETGRRPPPPPQAADAISGSVYHLLDREERRELRRLSRGRFDGTLERRLGELEELLEIITAEQLDESALREKLAEQDKNAVVLRQKFQDKWIEKLSNMTLEERENFAHRVEEHVQRLRKPRRK